MFTLIELRWSSYSLWLIVVLIILLYYSCTASGHPQGGQGTGGCPEAAHQWHSPQETWPRTYSIHELVICHAAPMVCAYWHTDDTLWIFVLWCVQVLDQYARTMFTVSTEAERLTAAKEQAADTLKKVGLSTCVCVFSVVSEQMCVYACMMCVVVYRMFYFLWDRIGIQMRGSSIMQVSHRLQTKFTRTVSMRMQFVIAIGRVSYGIFPLEI